MWPDRAKSKRLEREYSNDVGYSTEQQLRTAHLREWLGFVGADVIIEPTLKCDYGYNISIGDNSYMNFDCVLLDVGRITIGKHVLFGPAVHLYAATHPLDAEERRLYEYGWPITIEDDCWIGGGSKVLANRPEGIVIGRGSVIGAGSVVTRSIPPFSLAVGSPARVIRDLRKKDAALA